jgi:hypothetical protein
MGRLVETWVWRARYIVCVVCVAVPPASENAPRVSRRCAIETVLELIWLVRASWREKSRDSGPTLTSQAVRTAVDPPSLDFNTPKTPKGASQHKFLLKISCLARDFPWKPRFLKDLQSSEMTRQPCTKPMMNLISLEGSRFLASLGVDSSSTLSSRIRESRNKAPNGGRYGDQNLFEYSRSLNQNCGAKNMSPVESTRGFVYIRLACRPHSVHLDLLPHIFLGP